MLTAYCFDAQFNRRMDAWVPQDGVEIDPEPERQGVYCVPLVIFTWRGDSCGIPAGLLLWCRQIKTCWK